MLGRRDGVCVTRERPPSCPRGPQRREGPAVGRARRRGAGTAFLAFGEGTAFLAGVSREEKSGEIGRRARRPLVRGVAITEREALAERGCSRGSDRANRHPWVRFGLPTDEARVPGRARAARGGPSRNQGPGRHTRHSFVHLAKTQHGSVHAFRAVHAFGIWRAATAARACLLYRLIEHRLLVATHPDVVGQVQARKAI